MYYVRKLIKFISDTKNMRLIKADDEGEGTTIAENVTKGTISDMYLIYS